MSAPKFEIGQRVTCGRENDPGIIRNIFPSTTRPGKYCYGVQLCAGPYFEDEITAAPSSDAIASKKSA